MSILGFTISMPVFWLIVAAIFLVIEGITMGLTTIWFTGGAIVALVVALLGGGTVLQVIMFFAASILLLVFTRKLFVSKLHTGAEKTNVEALLGMEAVVITQIEPFKPGQIRLGGQEWTAIASDEDITIAKDEKVKVIKIEGVKAIVKPIQ